jgi:hypothetical protein
MPRRRVLSKREFKKKAFQGIFYFERVSITRLRKSPTPYLPSLTDRPSERCASVVA